MNSKELLTVSMAADSFVCLVIRVKTTGAVYLIDLKPEPAVSSAYQISSCIHDSVFVYLFIYCCTDDHCQDVCSPRHGRT